MASFMGYTNNFAANWILWVGACKSHSMFPAFHYGVVVSQTPVHLFDWTCGGGGLVSCIAYHRLNILCLYECLCWGHNGMRIRGHFPPPLFLLSSKILRGQGDSFITYRVDTGKHTDRMVSLYYIL